MNQAQAIEYLWRQGDLKHKLQPQQIPIYDGIRNLAPGIDEAVILCSRQFGKSWLGVLMALEDCIRYPNKCIVIVGPTLDQTREIVVPRLELIRADAPPGFVQRLKSEKKWFVGHSELVIGGFDVNSSSQRGKTVQNIYIEEVVDSHPDTYSESMRSDLGPALTRSDRGKMIFLTTPPKVPDHPFITDTMARAELNNALYRYTIDDNKELTREQYEACVRRCGGRDTTDFKREYLVEIVRDESIVVVPRFDRARHVKEYSVPAFGKWQLVCDWGGVRDLTCALLYTYDYFSNRMLIWDERRFGPNTATSIITEELRRLEASVQGVSQRVVDAPGQVHVDLNVQLGYECRVPAKDDWISQVNQLNVAFAQDRIWVHPRCKFLIQSLVSGIFNRNRTDFERTEALGHCDALAAAVYGYRSMDRSNPYPMGAIPENVFQRPEPKPEDVINAAIVKVGGFTQKGIKRFGNKR
jgi:hypothetical protein